MSLGGFQPTSGFQPAPGLQLQRPLSANDPSIWVASAAQGLVAVKFGQDGVEVDQERFGLMVRSYAHLNDPHLLAVHGSGVVPGGPAYVVMELLEGRSLSSRIVAGPLSQGEASEMLQQCCGSLSRTHAAGLVHGALRSTHVFLGGASGVQLAPLDHRSAPPHSLAALCYASPEILIQGRAPTPQDDLWALCVVLYEALTTILPFEGATQEELAETVRNGRFTLPSRYRADLSDAVDQWFSKAFASSPLSRFRTPSELSTSFAAALGGSSTASGLARVDEDELDDEKTTQWELPDEWSHGRSSVPSPDELAAHIARSRASQPSRPVSGPPPMPGTPAFRSSSAPGYGGAAAPHRPSLPAPSTPSRPPSSLPPPSGSHPGPAPIASASAAFGPPRHTASSSSRPRLTPPPSSLLNRPTLRPAVAAAAVLTLLALSAIWWKAGSKGERELSVTSEAAQGQAAPVAAGPIQTINTTEFIQGNDAAGQTRGAGEVDPGQPVSKISKLRARKKSSSGGGASAGTTADAKSRSKSKSKRKRRRLKKGCKHPYTIDERGIRRVKPECL